MYFLTTGSALTMAPYILTRKGIAAVKTKWRENALPITVAGVLTFAAYGLGLTAFPLSRVSYVASGRVIGIVIGVMGVFLLKEPFGGGRLLGSGSISWRIAADHAIALTHVLGYSPPNSFRMRSPRGFLARRHTWQRWRS